MSPETRAFLERVRSAEDPSADDERRVLAAVRATVAAGAVTGAAGAVGSKWLELLGAWGVPGLKVGPVVLCVLAAAGAADVPVSGERPVTRPVQLAPRIVRAPPATCGTP